MVAANVQKLQPTGFWFLSVFVWHKSEAMELENAEPIDDDINQSRHSAKSHPKDFS